MTREAFLGVFLGVICKKAEQWLPEEAQEEEMLDIMQQRLFEHNQEIRTVLNKIGG